MGSFKRFGRLDSSHFLNKKDMGRLKEFLINEQMRITGNWREQDHHEYLAWRSKIEKEHLEYEGRKQISRGNKQRDSKKNLG